MAPEARVPHVAQTALAVCNHFSLYIHTFFFPLWFSKTLASLVNSKCCHDPLISVFSPMPFSILTFTKC